MIIKKFLSQKCIGYNWDGTLTYYQAEAVIEGGKVKTVYGWGNKGYSIVWSESPPRDIAYPLDRDATGVKR